MLISFAQLPAEFGLSVSPRLKFGTRFVTMLTETGRMKQIFNHQKREWRMINPDKYIDEELELWRDQLPHYPGDW